MKNYREVKIGPYSAYAIAKKNGFEGTEEEWLESLKPPAVDKTLTEEGQAADAKVTGDALATKAIIDDAAVGTDAWSSKRIIDTLCPPISETGNPVQCSPVAGYPLGCKVSWEPAQDGSGTPYPAGSGPNLLDISQCTAIGKVYGVTITIDGDVFKISGVPSSEVTEEGLYQFAVASCTQTELRGKGYKITAFALKGNVSSAWGLRTEDEGSLAISAKLIPGVNTDIQFRLMVSKDTPAAYAPYENIRPIKGRDRVTVERCGGNLLPFSKQSFKFTQYLGPYAVNLKAGTYYLSCGNVAHDGKENPVIAFTDEKLITYYFLTKGSGQIVKLNRDCHIIYLYANHYDFNGSAGITATIEDLMLVPGTTAPTTYAPYTGQTATLSLPRTIYGGTVDAVTGEGLGVWKLLTLDGTEPWNAVGSGDTLYFQSTSISIGTRVLSRGDYCTTFPIASVSSSNTVQGVSGWKTSLYLRWSTFADVAALKSYLAAQYAAGTPVQVCYKLATPTPFTATGAQPIPALPGVNTLMTDADSVAVTGRADPIKRITDLEDAVASMTNT